ncbi:hypothetical protein [Lelliottia amnigena]|uniref:hypothetical protein n=1 Tax=Lelliottia amnigena TaxID=61646 RepID=UPI003BA14A4C
MTITREFTKEQLIAKAEEQIKLIKGLRLTLSAKDHVDMCSELFAIALASLKAEPASFDDLRDAVAEVSGGNAMVWSDIYKGHQAVPFINFNSLVRIVEKFRTALPAPVVPDEMDDAGGVCCEVSFADGWSACRAAMQGKAEPVAKNFDNQVLSGIYHAQEKRLFKLAQRIKGPSFDKYAYSPSQAIDVLEAAIFCEDETDNSSMLAAAPQQESE